MQMMVIDTWAFEDCLLKYLGTWPLINAYLNLAIEKDIESTVIIIMQWKNQAPGALNRRDPGWRKRKQPGGL
jgi:hypothetical protein